MFCNGALVALILKTGGIERLSVQSQVDQGDASSVVKTYLTVVLWSVAGLSSFKFVGAMWYLIKRIVSNSGKYLYEGLLTSPYSSSAEIRGNRALDASR